MNINYSHAKSLLDIHKVLTYYGLEFKRGKALCPFRKEKTASLTVSTTKQMFKCHGCEKGGDAITFVALLFNLSNHEALKKLNQDFGLGLDIRRPSLKDQIRYDAEKKKQEEFRRWELHALNVLTDNYKLWKKWAKIFENAWIYNEELRAEHLLDIYLGSTDEEKLRFRRVVDELERGKHTKHTITK